MVPARFRTSSMTGSLFAESGFRASRGHCSGGSWFMGAPRVYGGSTGPSRSRRAVGQAQHEPGGPPGGTHLERDQGNESVLGDVVREVPSTATLAVSVGPPRTSIEVTELLDLALEVTGVAPLVLAHDNGPENQGEVDRWCERARRSAAASAPAQPGATGVRGRQRRRDRLSRGRHVRPRVRGPTHRQQRAALHTQRPDGLGELPRARSLSE